MLDYIKKFGYFNAGYFMFCFVLAIVVFYTSGINPFCYYLLSICLIIMTESRIDNIVKDNDKHINNIWDALTLISDCMLKFQKSENLSHLQLKKCLLKIEILELKISKLEGEKEDDIKI